MKNVHLVDLKVGETAIIIKLSGEINLQQRLLALGFRPGKHIKILRKAWLNGPYTFKLGQQK